MINNNSWKIVRFFCVFIFLISFGFLSSEYNGLMIENISILSISFMMGIWGTY